MMTYEQYLAEVERFQAEIETFLAETGMTATGFGFNACRDNSFVFELRSGREPSIKTMAKVRAWMAGQREHAA